MQPHSEENRRLSVETHLDCIRGIIRRLCCRKRLGEDNEEEFSSFAVIRLLSDDQAILRQFEGRSHPETYLLVVLERLLIDWQNARWGRWRPTAKARRLGLEAVALERLVVRDRWTIGEAIERLTSDPRVLVGRDELETLAGELCFIPRRFIAGEDAMPVTLVAPESSDAGLDDAERRKRGAVIAAALSCALKGLEPEEQVLVRLRFEEGLSVRRIAHRLGYDAKRLYRKYARMLLSLRSRLLGQGIDWPDVLEVVGWSDLELRLEVLSVEGPEERGAPGTQPERCIGAKSRPRPRPRASTAVR